MNDLLLSRLDVIEKHKRFMKRIVKEYRTMDTSLIIKIYEEKEKFYCRLILFFLQLHKNGQEIHNLDIVQLPYHLEESDDVRCNLLGMFGLHEEYYSE